MRKNILYRNGYLLLTVIMMLYVVSCKKGNKKDDSPQETKIVKSVLLNNTTASPGDIITVKTSFKLDKDSWEISIGSKKVQLGKLDDSTAVFTAPYITAGTTTIDFNNLGVLEKTNFTIAAYTPVQDPETVRVTFNDNFNQAITSVDDVTDKNLLNTLQTAFNQKYALLKDDEKKEVAFALQNMKFDQPVVQGITSLLNPSLSTNSIKLNNRLTVEVPVSIRSDAEYYGSIITCGALYVAYASLTVAGSVGIAAPTGISQVLGLASVGYGFYLGTRGKKYWNIIKAYNGQNKTVETPSIFTRLYSNNIKDKKVNTINHIKLLDAAVDSNMTFTKTVSYSVNINGKYNGLSAGGSTNVVLNDFMTKLNNFVIIYAKMEAILNSIKSWFSSDPVLAPFSMNLPTTPAEELKNIPVELINIENVSDPAISLTKSGTGTAIVLKAVSSTITTARPFTFDLVYKNTGLKITTRKTLSAVYDGGVYPEKIEIASGNNQAGDLNKKLPLPLMVKITDKDGKPVSTYKVQWSITSGGGSLNATESTTGDNGIAQVEWTLGASGQQVVNASSKKSDGTVVPGSPITINATIMDSLSMYQAAVAGNWKNTWYGPFLGTVDDYVLNSDGTGQCTYTTTAAGGHPIPTGDVYNTVTWSVYKTGDSYYITMPYNNRNISFGGKLINYPNLSFKAYPQIGSTDVYTIFKKE